MTGLEMADTCDIGACHVILLRNEKGYTGIEYSLYILVRLNFQ